MTKDPRPSCVRPLRLWSRSCRVAGVALCLIAFSSPSFADDWFVTRASGDVRIKGDGFEWVDLSTRRALPSGYSLSTGWNGRVLLRRGNERLLLSPRMSIVLPKGRADSSSAHASPGQASQRQVAVEPPSPAGDAGTSIPDQRPVASAARTPELSPEKTDATKTHPAVAPPSDVATNEEQAPPIGAAPRPRPRAAFAASAELHPLKRAMTTLRTVTTTLRDMPVERVGKPSDPGRSSGPILIDRIRQGSD